MYETGQSSWAALGAQFVILNYNMITKNEKNKTKQNKKTIPPSMVLILLHVVNKPIQ